MSMTDRIDALPTLSDDQRWTTLLESMDRLGSEVDALREELPDARQQAEALREEADELEIEVHADPDLTESDVQAAVQAAEDAEATVEKMEREHEKKTEALNRIQDRRSDEREAAGARMYDQYAEVAEDVYADVISKADALLGALETLDTLHARSNKAAINGAAQNDRTLGPPIRTDSGRTAKVRELKEQAEGWMKVHASE